MTDEPRGKLPSRIPVDLTIAGKTGLVEYGGYVFEEALAELQLDRGRRIYREMAENDPVVGAVLFAVEMLIRQVPWVMSAADESPQAQAVAEFVEQCRSDMDVTWSDLVAEVLSMLTYGWSYFETIYKVRGGASSDPRYRSKYDDGRVGWRNWSIRGQDSLLRWDFDQEGGIRGLWQLPPPDYQLRYVPIEKALLFRTTSRKNNPEGFSVLRRAYRPWFFKHRIENIEGIGIERDLAGLPVVWAPAELFQATASADQTAILDMLKKIVTGIRKDEQMGVVMPLAYDENGKELYRLQLLSTGGQRQIDTNAVIQRYDQRIAMTVLADFILLGHEAVGSFALSSNKTNLFGVALGAWLDLICAVVNHDAIPKLLVLNGIDPALAPSLGHGDIESIDLGELGEYVLQLAQAGFPLFPNEEVQNYLLKAADLPATVEAEQSAMGAMPKTAPPVIAPMDHEPTQLEILDGDYEGGPPSSVDLPVGERS
ncbi:MAG: hypothetical protein KGL39_36865 [Patescibacteria group bacterium]|nr:hypothetical protein [Patescibacteria group bacterium]